MCVEGTRTARNGVAVRAAARGPVLHGGTRDIPLVRILEDPNDRQSHDSYFIQLADWNAYAAHRSTFVQPLPGVDPAIWDSLGGARLLDVNSIRGGPPGIVLWP